MQIDNKDINVDELRREWQSELDEAVADKDLEIAAMKKQIAALESRIKSLERYSRPLKNWQFGPL